jgi:lysine-specific demethylase/histidyl-hydroxylase NO66
LTTTSPRPVPKAPLTAAHPVRLVFMMVVRTAVPIRMVVPTAAQMPVPIPTAALTAVPMPVPVPTPMAAPTAVQTKAPKPALGDRPVSGALRRLTGMSLPVFDAVHWGRSPLLRRGAETDGAGFHDLFSRDAVDELLSRRGLRTPFLRMTKWGSVIPTARYTRSGGAGAEIADQIADDKVLAEFSAGATIVLQGLHRTWGPIQDFSNTLTAELGHPVQVNSYVTPPMSQALDPHYDVHDVFLIQFAGRKHWRIHEPVFASPLRQQPWKKEQTDVAERSRETPIFDIVLEPGDVLYLPRGYIHAATSLDEISGHLTFGVHPVTRFALAEQIFATLTADASLRQSLPAGLDLAAETGLDEELAVTIAAMRDALDRIDRDVVARGMLRNQDGATRPQPLSPLGQFAAASSLESTTALRLRSGLRVALESGDERYLLRLPGKDVSIALDVVDAVRAAISGAIVTADTLAFPDLTSGMRLLSELIRAGVLVPA